MQFFERLQFIDRRILFLFLAAALILPFFFPFQQKILITQEVKNFHRTIDSLPEGAVVAISFDYGPSAMPEINPMARAMIEQIFQKNLKLITYALWQDGEPFSIQIPEELAKQHQKIYGEHYVTLGFKPGRVAVILQMGEDIHTAFPMDSKGTRISDIPLMKNIRNYSDLNLLIDLAAGADPDLYVGYAVERYHIPFQAGVTAVMAANFYPYLQTRQMKGLLPGLKGASEYEFMVTQANSRQVTQMMASQSLVHLIMVLFILLGNMGYFLTKSYKKQTQQKGRG